MEGTVAPPTHTLMLDCCLLVISFKPLMVVVQRPTTNIFWLLLLPNPSLAAPAQKLPSSLVQLRVVAGVHWICRILPKVGF